MATLRQWLRARCLSMNVWIVEASSKVLTLTRYI